MHMRSDILQVFGSRVYVIRVRSLPTVAQPYEKRVPVHEDWGAFGRAAPLAHIS